MNAAKFYLNSNSGCDSYWNFMSNNSNHPEFQEFHDECVGFHSLGDQ